MEDYLQMLLQMTDYAPDVLFTSPAFPIAFRAAMAALTLVQADIVFAALDFIRSVITHDCLDPSLSSPPPKFPIYAAAITPVIEQEGPALTGYLLAGVVGDFPEESTSTVIGVFRRLASLWPTRLLSWLPVVLQQLPSASAPDQAKTEFVNDMSRRVF